VTLVSSAACFGGTDFVTGWDSFLLNWLLLGGLYWLFSGRRTLYRWDTHLGMLALLHHRFSGRAVRDNIMVLAA
jgi:hypothetical protein